MPDRSPRPLPLAARWPLLVVSAVEGAALMAVELIGARVVAPTYGSSLYVWSAVLAMTVGGLTIGYALGGRVSYAMTKNLKWLTELGYSQKKPDGAATQKLTKLTFGPALSTGPDFWTRPELRLYVTTAKWNDAANAAAGAGGVTGIGDGRTSGTSYGAQVEIWF